MTEIFDDTISEKPEDAPVLTAEYLESIIAKMKREPVHDIIAPARFPERDDYIPRGLYLGPRVFASPYLPDEQPRKLTRWERFRVWVENLADRAGVYYHFPRVKRTEPAPAYLIGRDLYVPQRTATAIRLTSGGQPS